jgi:glycosyltransferase involved in cell wall biosynthesis
MAMRGNDVAQRTVFYVGGFEAVGGIESFLLDVLTTMSPGSTKQSMLTWAKDLPALREIEASGTKVLSTRFRRGCRLGLPDALLYIRHGSELRGASRVVFAKIPPAPIFARVMKQIRAQRRGAVEAIYVTPYRPNDMWPDAMPEAVRLGMDRIILQSSDFVDDLRRLGFLGTIDIVPYIPPAVTAAPFDDDRDGRPFRLGFLGRFAPQKNLFYLLDIMEELRSKGIELHLFGGGGEEAGLRARVSERGIPAIFHGVLPREQVFSAIDGCDAFINPSLSEGQCLVALEVLSRGRPFIGTPVGAVADILRNDKLGVSIPLSDAGGAARQIARFVDEWRAGGWRAADVAGAYVSAFPRDRIINDYERLLSGAVSVAA